MKKKLIVALASLLCLCTVGSAAMTALSTAASRSAETELAVGDRTYTYDKLADSTPTFNTTEPATILLPKALSNTSNSNARLGTPVITDDYITYTPTGADPYYQPVSSVDPAGRYVVIMYRSSNADTTTMQFYIGSSGTAPSDDTTMMETSVVADGQWHTQVFDTQPLIESGVYNGTNATFFRFDPLESGYVLNEDGEPYKDANGWVKYTLPEGASVDVRFIAFFDTEEAVNGFDIDQYLAKLAYEEEQKRLEEEAKKKYDWPSPTYTDMETVAEDNAEGSLTYTVSEDGSTVTISYLVNGETVSYSVPNNINYTSGGYAGVDDLDRSLYDSSEVGSYGSTGEKYVGLFYFLWQGEHGDSGIFDLQKIIDTVGVEAAGSTNCGMYGPVGAMHWFAEPLYGYYYANDAWVHRKHAELLTNANIDFLYFDVTNGYTYLHNATQLMAILHELNEQGYDAPQVVFYTNSNAEGVIETLYNNVYKAGLYPDTWFCINGKPVIIGPQSANIDDFFTMKQNQWPTETSKRNGWPWMDFQWPSRLFRSRYDFDGSAISVSIAQHSGTVAFSDSSLYGNYTNRGRSFNAEEATDETLKAYREAWDADNSLTNYGLNFQAQWDRAIESDAMYVLVTGWNEWVAQRQNTGSDRIWFVDTASMEYSRDAEMMRGGYFDNYYMQLIYNVQRLKGTAPIVVQDERNAINVTGDFSQWDNVTVTYTDPTGDTVDRDATGFGKTHYTNTSGRNDIVAAKVTADTKNVYFYVETAENIPMYDTESSWMQLYINTDCETTGWYGYDYIINYQAKSGLVTTVAKYNGVDGAYSFQSVGEVSYQVKGNRMMIAVPQEMLGLDGYLELCFEFKWADSETVYDEMEDFYIDGDVAPLGRLNYIYQNYIPGVSEVVYPSEETTEEATTPTEPDTTVAPDTDETTLPEETAAPGTTEPDTDNDTKKGCSSIIGSAAVVLTGMLATVAVIRKRKDE